VSFSVSGFYENFTCSVSMGWDDPFGYNGWRSYNYGPTFSGSAGGQTEWYGPSGATVTCQGSGPWGRTATGSASW